jgi:type III pantothenate kinase
MPRILTVDVGNTRAKFGIFEIGPAACPQPLIISAVQLDGIADLAEELAQWYDESEISDVASCVVSGSNPPIRSRLLNTWPWPELPPQLIDSHSSIPLQVDVETPETVGIDRLLTAYAARTLFSTDQPIVVIDSGTATTVNLTTSDGTFRGGAILPGLRMSAFALHDYTARLPQVDTDSLSTGRHTVDAPLPGRNTIEAMKSGLFWGQLGAIKEISQRLAVAAAETYRDERPALFILTGGGGRQLVTHLTNAIYIDSLALHGLALFAEVA